MWNQIYTFLFNPNHDAPSVTVIIIFIVLVIIANFFKSWYESTHQKDGKKISTYYKNTSKSNKSPQSKSNQNSKKSK